MSDDDEPNANGNTVNSKGDVEADNTVPSATVFETWLDRKLKTAYGSVLEEQIPQDLIDLLRAKLDKPSA